MNVAITEISSKKDLTNLAARHPDLVFSGVKFFTFNDGDFWLNDFLDTHEISYIGSDCSALHREHDKCLAKDIIRRAGISTASYFTSKPGEHPTIKSVPVEFPVFVKPIRGGDSIGVDIHSIAHNFESMNAKILSIHRLQKSRSLIEKYLPGKEYSVGIFENDCTKELTAMPIEIITNANENGKCILDFETKKNDEETVLLVKCPVMHKQLSDLAKAAFFALGSRSFGRIDVILSATGAPNFIEANLMPGLSNGYFFRACAINLGINYEQMIIKITNNRLAY